MGPGALAMHSITYAVATLVVAHPRALALAVPMVLVAAGGIAARNRAIIKSADNSEGARKTTVVVFDKTGIKFRIPPKLRGWGRGSVLCLLFFLRYHCYWLI